MMDEARKLLSFACKIYKMQYEAGRVFLHEHPATAQSWQESEIQKMLKLPGVARYDLDMCQFGLQTSGAIGTGPVKKATTLMTNSKIMGTALSKKFNGGHKHLELKGGSRCAKAAIYTKQFCAAVVKAYQKHWKRWGRSKPRQGNLPFRDYVDSQANDLQIGADDLNDCPTIDELIDMLCIQPSARFPKSNFEEALDSAEGAEPNPGEGWEAWNDVKHRPLNPKLV